jgi:RNA polymerase sigma-70 factor (ECF subfamily)
MMSDATAPVIERARQRDPDAIAELYRQHVQAIARYIGYRVADSAAIEDLTAEVFLRMVEGLPRYRPTGAPFEAWLYRIAAAQVANYYRQRQRRPLEELSESMRNGHPPVEMDIQRKEELAELQAALNRLDEEHQTILFLRFVERKSHDETARILGKSVQAVATAQHRALKRLAALLGGEKSERHYLRGRPSS